MNWIKSSHRLPPIVDSYSKRYLVITDEGADFGTLSFAGLWRDDEGYRIKVYYWMEPPGES